MSSIIQSKNPLGPGQTVDSSGVRSPYLDSALAIIRDPRLLNVPGTQVPMASQMVAA